MNDGGEGMAMDVNEGLARRMESEWRALVGSPTARRALGRWAAVEPALAGWADLDALRAATEDRADVTGSDAILAALVRQGAQDAGDDLVAVRVLLQLLLSGAMRLVRRVTAVTGDLSDAEATVMAELTMLIRTYPWQRRPARIAANLLLDCQQRILRAARRVRGQIPVGLDPFADATPAADPAAEAALGERVELLDLFLWAQREGVLSREEVLLIAGNRVDEVPIRQLAPRLGRRPTALFALRTEAENRLRAALLPAAA
jgi:hypothetical protein